MPAANADLCLFATGEKTYGREKLRTYKTDPRYLTYAILGTPCVVWSEGIQSVVNVAALMAQEDPKSLHLKRLEDSEVHRLWRLINALWKVRQGALEKKDVK